MILLAASPDIGFSHSVLIAPSRLALNRQRGARNKASAPPDESCLHGGGLLVPSYTATPARDFTGKPVMVWRCVNCEDCFDAQILANRRKNTEPTGLRARPGTGGPRPGPPPRLLSPCDDLQALIAKRAYELYSQRGCRDGSVLDDWLDAEREFSISSRRSDRAAQRGWFPTDSRPTESVDDHLNSLHGLSGLEHGTDEAFYQHGLGLHASYHYQDVWAVVAFEVSDLDTFVHKMKERAVSFVTEAFDTPVCRMAVIEDPDNNHITIHQRHA